jgi:tetratricopeptide (TPR) repeat protein
VVLVLLKYTFAALAVFSIAITAHVSAYAQGPLGVKVSSGTISKDGKKARLEANFHFNQAEDFRAKRKYNEAIEEYEKAIKAYPNDGAYYKNLGATYATVGKLPEAETTLKTGTKIAPKDWLMWNNLAVVFLNEKKSDECAAALRQALTNNPPADKVAGMKSELKNMESQKTSSK